MALAQPAHFSHLLASSPFHEMPPCDIISPPISPASDATRYFSEREYDEALHGYSSPPSSVPSSGNTSYNMNNPFPAFHDFCPDASYRFNSSPLNANQAYHLPEPLDTQILPFPSDDLYAGPYQAPRAAMIPGMNMDRPEPKRRKTCPEIVSSPTSRRRDLKDKRGAGKDGEDVWPVEVESAFFESIRLVPKLGRKKIAVNGKPCGRNELIGDYIRRKTGRIRSRKQVSSHIQVLKNIRRHDYEFMDLVAEPRPGEGEEDFTEDAHQLFFQPQEFAHVTSEALMPPILPAGYPLLSPAPSSASTTRDGLLSPYCGGSFFSQASSSGASSPALSTGSTRSVSPYPYGLAAPTPSNEDLPISSQVFQLKLAPPSPAFCGPTPLAHATTAPYGAIKGDDDTPTPKSSPSKLGHRRAASRGLALTIPPNTFGTIQQTMLQPVPTIEAPGGESGMHPNPSTPWPQVLHTPTCPPPAPHMLASPTQRNRLPLIWANNSADWNKASPALEACFEHELSAAVASSRNMQTAAARSSTSMKRSNTDIPVSAYAETKIEGFPSKKEDADMFFSSLLGSREY